MKIKAVIIIIFFLTLGSIIFSLTVKRKSGRSLHVVPAFEDTGLLFDDFIFSLKQDLKKFYKKRPIDKKISSDLSRRVLHNLIEKRLILEEGQRLNITVGEDDVDARMEQILKGYTKQRLRYMLKEKDITYPEWRRQLKEKILIEKIVKQEVDNNIIISLKEQRDYYEKNPDEFLHPDMVRAFQIVVETENDARLILERLKRKESFIELAKDYSISPEAQNGGDLGFFMRGIMPKEFNIVFNLSQGELSDIIKTPYGYHIFLVKEKRNEKKEDFFNVQDKIIKRLFKKKQNRLYIQWINRLSKKASIKLIR